MQGALTEIVIHCCCFYFVMFVCFRFSFYFYRFWNDIAQSHLFSFLFRIAENVFFFVCKDRTRVDETTSISMSHHAFAVGYCCTDNPQLILVDVMLCVWKWKMYETGTSYLESFFSAAFRVSNFFSYFFSWDNIGWYGWFIRTNFLRAENWFDDMIFGLYFSCINISR